MRNYLKEEPTRNYDYAEAGGKPYIIIRDKDGSTKKILIDKNAKYYNDLKKDIEDQGTTFDELRSEYIRRREKASKKEEEKEPPKQEQPKQEAPKQKPQSADIRGGDDKVDGYGKPKVDYTKKEPEPPKTKPIEVTPHTDTKTEPPKQAPRPRQTPQQKAGLPKSVPAAFVPDVVKYQKARQKAITSGNQKQMDKVRNDGMAIWAKLYGPGGKKELKYPTARQKEIFKQHSSNTTNQGSSGTLTSSQKDEILKRGAEARQSIEKEAQKRGIPKMDDKKLLGKVGAGVKFESTNIVKEPYDLILEYLLENGHADTIDEANYIMLKLDSQSIQTIVENVQGGPILPGEKGKKVYPKGKEPKPTGAQLPKV